MDRSRKIVDSKDWQRNIESINFIIQVSADRLKNDREKCSNSNNIESILSGQEAKLVKHLSHVLYWQSQNARLNRGKPSENQIFCSSSPSSSSSICSWLDIVNIERSRAKALENGLNCDLRTLISYSESHLKDICEKCGVIGENRRRFLQATSNLRNYTNRWIADGEEPVGKFSDSELSWVSYDRPGVANSSKPFSCQIDTEFLTGNEGSRRSVSESGGIDSGASDSGVGSNVSQNSLPTTTPPPSPGYLLATTTNTLSVGSKKVVYSSEWSHVLSVGQTAKSLRGITPPATPLQQSSFMSGEGSKGKASSTPPAAMKWGTGGGKPKDQSMRRGTGGSEADDSASGVMMRSHSHESNLQNRILKNPAPFVGLRAKTCVDLPVAKNKSRQSVIDGTGLNNPSASQLASPDESSSRSVYNKYLSPTSPTPAALVDSFNQTGITGSFVGPPKSPRTARLTHSIPHQFQKKFLPGRTCFICQKQLGVRGEKCKSCRVKVHTDCKGRLGTDTCGLTKEHARAIIHLFLKTPIHDPVGGACMSGSQSAGHLSGFETPGGAIHDTSTPYSETFESSSSTNSSTPSTPAPGSQPSPFPLQLPPRKFTFSEVREVPDITVDSEPNEEINPLVASHESDMTLKSVGSGVGTGSERTLSQEEVLTDSIGSQELESQSRHQIRRNMMGSTVRGTSSWQDVTIKLDKIDFPEKEEECLVGRGLFGVVKRGYFFMDVAVKFLNMDHVERENQLEAFKQEVAPFKNTRHENIVLLIGYCLEAPNLGIVMNYCKGRTLHTILYNSRDRLDLNKVLNIAAQITQGMSYLHGKHIMHKDLRSKNIFLENNKVVITDFGLFSVRRLVKVQKEKECKGLHVPDHWLCYLSPEIVRSLVSLKLGEEIEELPFSFASDVYAFGTVLYELVSGDYPFKKYPAEAIVWQVGRGIKPALNNLQAAKEIKDILMHCWAYQPIERPDFNELFKTLERLPRKRLARSPSHPVHLSRSYESMF